MLDIGWTELLVIAIVMIVVVGPKDLPPMLRAFGKMTSNLRKMAGDFRTQLDEALKETELDDVRKTISDAQRLKPTNALRDAINPLRQMGQEIRSDLQKATQVPTQPISQTPVSETDIDARSAVEETAGEPVAEVPTNFPPQPVAPATPAAPPVVSAPVPAPAQPAPVAAAAVATEKPKSVRKVAAKAKPADDIAAAVLEKPKRTAPRAKPVPTDMVDVPAAIPAPRKRAAKKTDAPKDDA